MRGRYTFVELRPYKYGDAPRTFYTDRSWSIASGLLRLVTDTGLQRNVDAAHFMLMTPVSQRLFPGLGA